VQIAVKRDALIEDEATALEVGGAAFLKILQDAAVELEDFAKTFADQYRCGFLATDAARAEGYDGLLLQ